MNIDAGVVLYAYVPIAGCVPPQLATVLLQEMLHMHLYVLSSEKRKKNSHHRVKMTKDLCD